MLRAQSINTECENSENFNHISASTLTLTSKASKQKTYAFATNSSSDSMFTFAKTNKTAENQLKSNAKKQKIKETSKKITRKMSESIDSDTEKKDLTAAHKTVKKALWNLLNIVNTERKIEIKQVIYYLEKALK